MKKVPVMGIVVVTIIVLFIGFIVYTGNKSRDYMGMSSRQLALRCLPMEGSALHIHSHLSLVINKEIINLPQNVGIDPINGCMNSIHIHDETNLIHVESPAVKDFTLGDFFAVLKQNFDKSQVMNHQVDVEHGLKIYVNGKETDNFEQLLLQDKQDIFITYYNLKDGPDPIPQPYQWEEESHNAEKPHA